MRQKTHSVAVVEADVGAVGCDDAVVAVAAG